MGPASNGLFGASGESTSGSYRPPGGRWDRQRRSHTSMSQYSQMDGTNCSHSLGTSLASTRSWPRSPSSKSSLWRGRRQPRSWSIWLRGGGQSTRASAEGKPACASSFCSCGEHGLRETRTFSSLLCSTSSTCSTRRTELDGSPAPRFALDQPTHWTFLDDSQVLSPLLSHMRLERSYLRVTSDSKPGALSGAWEYPSQGQERGRSRQHTRDERHRCRGSEAQAPPRSALGRGREVRGRAPALGKTCSFEARVLGRGGSAAPLRNARYLGTSLESIASGRRRRGWQMDLRLGGGPWVQPRTAILSRWTRSLR